MSVSFIWGTGSLFYGAIKLPQDDAFRMRDETDMAQFEMYGGSKGKYKSQSCATSVWYGRWAPPEHTASIFEELLTDRYFSSETSVRLFQTTKRCYNILWYEIKFFWDMTPCRLMIIYWRFSGDSCFWIQGSPRRVSCVERIVALYWLAAPLTCHVICLHNGTISPTQLAFSLLPWRCTHNGLLRGR